MLLLDFEFPADIEQDNLAFVAEQECSIKTPPLDPTNLRLLLTRDSGGDKLW